MMKPGKYLISTPGLFGTRFISTDKLSSGLKRLGWRKESLDNDSVVVFKVIDGRIARVGLNGREKND